MDSEIRNLCFSEIKNCELSNLLNINEITVQVNEKVDIKGKTIIQLGDLK